MNGMNGLGQVPLGGINLGTSQLIQPSPSIRSFIKQLEQSTIRLENNSNDLGTALTNLDGKARLNFLENVMQAPTASALGTKNGLLSQFSNLLEKQKILLNNLETHIKSLQEITS